jgi:hypothetical protein
MGGKEPFPDGNEPNNPDLMAVRYCEYFNVFSFDSCGNYGYISVSQDKKKLQFT